MMTPDNPLGMRGLAFVETAGPNPDELDTLWKAFGFSKTRRHRNLAVDLYEQHDIQLLVNRAAGTFADHFQALHGPCICGLGIRVDNARAAYEEAVRRGARPFVAREGARGALDLPAVYGIGDALMYFVDEGWPEREFVAHPAPERVADKGFLCIDHLTNNVHKGTLQTWADYYKRIFGFTELRTFDIRGQRTGLYSFALQSPCKTFCIPINEGTESKSQIEEYLRDYHGPGVQHLAFLTQDLLSSLDRMDGKIPMLDIDDEYYATVFNRVPNVSEDHARIHKHQVLVDGDEDGYLLQIFTRNLMGPIFIELIQRKNHRSFGEGNFSALFRSIERDQERRGVL
ncbi:MAG: 4-hydroxyphenylpyruvate dioxygenase [Myxococcota bacterium]